MEREGIAYGFMVPTMVNAIVQDNSARGRDFPSLKCLLIAASPIQDATALAAREVFGEVLYQGYGQTEVLPVSMMGPRQWFAEVEGSTPLRSCGLALPFAEVEIWDEENRRVAANEVGEIVARADGMMSGFWNNEEATRERIVDGWIKTGDLGRLDANGYLYIVDRADDMIISGGFNIWPAELENAIANHPAVIEVAVFGVPHPKWGETPHAVCVVKDPDDLGVDEVMELAAQRTRFLQEAGRRDDSDRAAAQEPRRQDQAQGPARTLLGRPGQAGLRKLTPAPWYPTCLDRHRLPTGRGATSSGTGS